MDPQLAGRLGCLQEANVAAMVAAETYKGVATMMLRVWLRRA